MPLDSPNVGERLSEKVHEQRLERRFGRYTEREKGLRVLCSATLLAPPILFGQSQKMNSAKFAVASATSSQRKPLDNRLSCTPLGSKHPRLGSSSCTIGYQGVASSNSATT